MGESWSIMRHIRLQPAAERSCPACLLTHLPCYLKIDVKSRAHKFKMRKTTSSRHLVNTMYLLSFAALPQCFCSYPPLKNVPYASRPSSELCFFLISFTTLAWLTMKLVLWQLFPAPPSHIVCTLHSSQVHPRTFVSATANLFGHADAEICLWSMTSRAPPRIFVKPILIFLWIATYF